MSQQLVKCIIRVNRGWEAPANTFKFGLDHEFDYYISEKPLGVHEWNHHSTFIGDIQRLTQILGFKFSEEQEKFHSKLGFPKSDK